MLLRRYIESFSYNQNISRREKIEIGRKQLFDFPYPFFDETKRKDFETKFIIHFYSREIGSETMALFKMSLEDYLILNMPYWNKMFESELMEFPVFEDMDYTISEDENRSNNVQSTSDTDVNKHQTQTKVVDGTENKRRNTTDSTDEDNFSRNIYSDTPQKDLNITAGANGTGLINYASSIEETKQINHSDSTGTQNDVNTNNVVTDDSITNNDTVGNVSDKKQQQTKDNDKHYKGKKGDTDYATLLTKYRETFLRIEKQIFSEINKEGLFLLVYGGR